MAVTAEVRDGIAIVTFSNPPVNALTSGIPKGIAEAVAKACEDPAVRAIVVTGAGRTFAAGADIQELARFMAGAGPMPEFHRWLNAIEDAAKPVVMAIHGQALGAGLELAMAGHYRVITPDALVGQPEVKIGLIPGAAGTVRLPRLAGVEKAAEMCVFGDPVNARNALAAGIVDHIGDPIEFARTITQVRRTRDLPIRGAMPALVIKSRLEAPRANLEAIERTSKLDFEQGCKAEAEIFRRCLASTQARALIHAFFAERAAAKVEGVTKDTPVFPIREVGVIGAGTMGGGIAMALANAGIRVRLKDADPAALDRGLATICKNYDRSVTSGRLTSAQRDERVSKIAPQLDYAGFENVDLIIEAVFESLDLKRRIFAEIDGIAKPECLLASNTSTLDIDALAQATTRPKMVLGMHFFSPANVMRLLEVVRGRDTAPEVLATAMALAKTIRKTAVVVGNGFGFVGNRIVIPYMNQAEFLVEEGATPEQVDRVLTEFGMAMGPFAVADLSGLDVFWRIRQERAHAAGERQTLGVPLLYAKGRYGQKTGAGWFRYGDDRKSVPDPEAVNWVHAAARAAGIPQRAISGDEILDRCVFALVNEGARVLEEGVAARASDIDVVYLTGYGFPNYRGGPMFYADTAGLPRVLARIREFGWTPAPLLEKLVQEGRGFGLQ
ncbi:MAG: 3-hydroxyacyl-CoA dehydrogenase NAD-binding domain-containing protein [Acidobacteriota bacterium]